MTDGRTNEQTNGRTNERTNERTEKVKYRGGRAHLKMGFVPLSLAGPVLKARTRLGIVAIILSSITEMRDI